MFSMFNCSFIYHVQRGSSFLTSYFIYQDQLKGSFIFIGLEYISATRINNLFWMEMQPPKIYVQLCMFSIEFISRYLLFLCHMSNHTPSKQQNMKGKSANAAINHQIFLYALFTSKFDISIYEFIFLIVLQHTKKQQQKTLRFYDLYLHNIVKEWNKKNVKGFIGRHISIGS